MPRTFDVVITVTYEDVEDGHVMARIPAVPAVITSGATRDEARALVFDALAELLRGEEQAPAGGITERLALELVVGDPLA
jgi:predicted RNase H-like HicB family nuclease